MNDLVVAEWLKLRTTRLLHGTVPAAVGLSLAAVAGMVLSSHGPDLETADGVRRVFAAAGTGAIVVLVVGILIPAGEYRHGTASDTFLTTPLRRRVVAAKLVVGAAVGGAVGVLAAVSCIATAAMLYPTVSATLPLVGSEVWLTVPAAALYSALFAVLGVGLGSLVRNQVAAVAGALAWVAIVEHTLVNLIPSIGRWLPVGAGQAIVRTPIDGLLTPPAATVVLGAYAVVVAFVSIRAEEHRDA